jgi:CheY-like chemotaxis protein/HPt (histidine-containing phosphotransfer) domain-containing protein
LANMSHEIRSPMNAMLGFLYMLEQKPLDAEVRELVSKVRNGGKSLLTIINDILDFSKIEAGQLEIQRVPFRLSDVIDQVAALMSAYSVEKNLELIIDVYPTLADYLIGDAVKLQQVLVNLVSNAIKFTQQGEVKLMIKVIESLAENLIKIRFSVKDTGIGIDLAKQQEIFSPFTQADGSISRRFGGTGLGLAISRQMVELMGASLRVDSAAGKGSTFWFELVFEQDLSRNPEFSELKNLNVLIVDDCEAAMAALANAVKFLGWQAETAYSGEDACVQALTRLQTGKPYDVILVDWQMPGMDGITLASEIKKIYLTEANTALKPPLVIMVSAYSRDQLLSQPDIGNADMVLTKPVTPSTCYDSVLSLLSKRIKIPDTTAAIVRDANTLQLAGINVMVVDDSDINCDLAAAILSLRGAQVMTFTNGYKVIEWLKTHPDDTDIILMDVQMPDIDGYETTRIIRSIPHLAHIPIAALTAGAFTEDQDNAKAAGMDDFIPKPFDVDHLISVIQRLTRRLPELLTLSDDFSHISKSATIRSENDELQQPSLVDVDEGVSRFGNRSFYFSYLNKFIAADLNAGKDILALIQSGDATAAAAMAHKLKGTAGNLALKQVTQCAADIETSLKTNAEPKELCAKLQQTIEDTSIEIRRLTENLKTDE